MIGEMRMEKVKVTRYISGKRPAYADYSSSEESSSEEENEEEEKLKIDNIDIKTAQERYSSSIDNVQFDGLMDGAF